MIEKLIENAEVYEAVKSTIGADDISERPIKLFSGLISKPFIKSIGETIWC